MTGHIVRTLSVAVAIAALGCTGADPESPASGGAGGSSSGGSSSGGGPGCKLGFLGDPSAQVEMKVVARSADGVATEISDGAEVAMILPPQGGRVIFVGAFATNVSACGVELHGDLRDKTTGQVRVDARTTNLKPHNDGWGGPVDADISTFSNIPLCPNQWASTAVYDNPFDLTVTITDPEGRTATKTIEVVPVCGEPQHEAECLCQCQKDYVLGEACP
jgi:hypothetical protein